jgi:hypothetical protein
MEMTSKNNNIIQKNEWIVKVELIEKINDSVTVNSTLENQYQGPINKADDGMFSEDTMAQL